MDGGRHDGSRLPTTVHHDRARLSSRRRLSRLLWQLQQRCASVAQDPEKVRERMGPRERGKPFPAQPLRPIQEREIAAYEADGVTCIRHVFSQEWIRTMRDAVELAMTEPGPFAEEYTSSRGSGRFFGDLDMWRRHATFARFVYESCAAAIAAAVMRSSSATFFYDQLLVKEAGTAERTPWHQDMPYWAVQGRQICSLWLPLDDIPLTSAVEYVGGSHLWGQQFEPYHFMDGTPYKGTGLPPLPDIDAGNFQHILRWAMHPGDCLVFHGDIIHGAPGHQETGCARGGRRRALATRWLGDDARFCLKPGEVAIPTFETGLSHGDRMAGEHFPRII